MIENNFLLLTYYKSHIWSFKFIMIFKALTNFHGWGEMNLILKYSGSFCNYINNDIIHTLPCRFRIIQRSNLKIIKAFASIKYYTIYYRALSLKYDI
jgi:hypothetical protein